MAYDAKVRARCRRLYEYDGEGLETIAKKVKATVRCLEKWKAAEGWERFKHSAEVHEKERLTVLAEAERAGITVSRHLKELALIGYSDLANHVIVDKETGATRARTFEEMNELQPGASRVVKKVKEKRTVRKVPDSEDTIEEITVEYELHDKPGTLREITDILGIKKQDQEAEKANNTLIDLIRSHRPK